MTIAILIIAGIGLVAAVALALVTAGLLSLAFMGFSGMVKLPY